MQNKEEKTLYGNAIVYLTFIKPDEYIGIKENTPSSVHCFPVKNDEILFTVNQRGLDIIGGHIEKGETPEQALKREAMEEASITIKEYKLIGAIRVDNRDNPKAKESGYPEIGYQLFYAVTKFDTHEFKADFESTERKYVRATDIPKLHHKWLETHNDLLNEMSPLINVKKKNKIKP